MDLSALREQAELLRVPLRSSGPDATTENIMAAILIARGSHSVRQACADVPGSSRRANELVKRVRPALAVADFIVRAAPETVPPPPQPPPQVPPQLPPQLPSHHQLEQIFGQFGFNVETIRTDVDNLAEELGLPPLSGNHTFTSAEWVDMPMPDVPSPDSDAPLPLPEMARCEVRPAPQTVFNYHV